MQVLLARYSGRRGDKMKEEYNKYYKNRSEDLVEDRKEENNTERSCKA